MQIRSIPNRLLAFGTLLALAPAAPLAAQNLITNNPSFELPGLVDGASTTGIDNSPNTPLLNGWVVVGNVLPTFGTLGNEGVLTSNPTDAQYLGTSAGSPLPNPLDGTQVVSFRTGLLSLTGSATQVTNILLSVNNRFTLTIGVGNPLDRNFQGYIVSLVAGGTTLAVASDLLGGVSVPDGTFRDVTASFVFDPLNPALSNLVGAALTVSLTVPGAPLGSNFGTDFDNVRVTASPVPEPGTTASVAFGLLGLVGAQYARRRRGVSLRA